MSPRLAQLVEEMTPQERAEVEAYAAFVIVRRQLQQPQLLSDDIPVEELTELVEEAIQNGPQVITRRGKETAIVLSYEEYRKMLLRQQKLSDFFRASPLAGVPLDLTRDRSPIRDDIACHASLIRTAPRPRMGGR